MSYERNGNDGISKVILGDVKHEMVDKIQKCRMGKTLVKIGHITAYLQKIDKMEEQL
jgi:hypothetical protein